MLSILGTAFAVAFVLNRYVRIEKLGSPGQLTPRSLRHRQWMRVQHLIIETIGLNFTGFPMRNTLVRR
jgi:hypothetical protein